jgi:Predicted pPIWI-associating nuclease
MNINPSGLADIARHLQEIDRATMRPLYETADFVRRFSGLEKIAQELHKSHQSGLAAIGMTASSLAALTIPRDIVSAVVPQIAESERKRQQLIRDLAGPLSGGQLAFSSVIEQMLKFSEGAAAGLEVLRWQLVATTLGVSSRGLLRNRFFDFVGSYTDLIRSLETRPYGIETLPPVVSRLAPFEVYRAVELTERVIGPEAPEESEEFVPTGDLVKETEASLETLLNEFNPSLLSSWHGAKQAYESKNADYVRHVSVSLRELFTHVLDQLAPDPDVRLWTEDPRHYHDRRPTRKARLLYVCRSISSDPFADFVKKDVDAALAFLSVFQKTTHELATLLSDKQLAAMITRMEALLRYILELARKQ